MTTSADTAAILHRLNDATKPVDAADRNLIIRMLTAPTTGSAPEPVAEIVRWKTFTGHDGWDIKIFDKSIEHGTKLYAAPPANAPAASVLTDEQIEEIWEAQIKTSPKWEGRLYMAFARALLTASMGGDKA